MKNENKHAYNHEVYFASLEAKDLIAACDDRIEAFYKDLCATGLYHAVEKSYRAYYGAKLTGKNGSGQIFDSTDITKSGDKGEIMNLKVNHYRSLIKHSLQLATTNKPAYSCKATNSDYKSQVQTVLGDGLVDYYLREKTLGRIFSAAVENCLVTTEGWVHSPWNASAGEIQMVDPTTKRPIMEGDLEFSSHHLLDVVRDVSLNRGQEFKWLLLRSFENKHDLAALFPEKAEDILAMAKEDYSYESLEGFALKARDSDPESDNVTTWLLYHDKTDAMPQGRVFKFVGDVPLLDGPLPYRKIPLRRVTADELIGTPYGYSPGFDILGVQQAVDILSSTAMTNNGTYGVQNVWTKRNDNLSVKNLEGGLKNLQSDEMPTPIQLTKTAPETFEFRQALISEMETIMGISATVRGNPEASLKSGSALALVVAQSIQFASLLEDSYNRLFEDVGTDIIMQLRDFSKSKRVANILGISARPFRKEFTADDLSQINRVTVEAASPLSKTVAGRIQIAEDLLSKNFIETPKQYISVLTTGRLDLALFPTQSALLNIRAENEELQAMRPVSVIITENHADHIREHRTVIENPEAKKNPQLIKLVTDHIKDHVTNWRAMDPALLFVLGQEPPPPLPPPPGPPPGPGALPGAPNPGAQPGPGPGPVMKAPSPATEGQPNQPNMPSLPKEAPPEAQAALDKVG